MVSFLVNTLSVMHCYTLFSYTNPVQLDPRNQLILHKVLSVKGCALAYTAIIIFPDCNNFFIYQLRTNMSCLGGLSVTLTSTLLQCHHSTETAPVIVHNGILKADNYPVVTVKGLVQKWQKILL